MQILITYAGKTGTTEKCAKILGQKLQNTTTINLMQQEADVSNYNLIIIGASIRVGMIHKKVKNFIEKNKEILKNKKVAYYVCCGFSDNYKKYFEGNIPKELLDTAIIYDTFGGEMDLSKQRGFDKFIVNMISKTEEGKREVKILHDNIDKFVERVKEQE